MHHAVLLLLACAACGPVRRSCRAPDPSAEMPPGGTDVPVRRVLTDDSTGLATALRCVVNGREEWRAIAPRIATALPPADSAGPREETWLVVAMGEQPAVGYQVSVEGAAIVGDTLHVRVRSSAPTDADVLTQVTFPVAVAAVPRWSGPVRFHEQGP